MIRTFLLLSLCSAVAGYAAEFTTFIGGGQAFDVAGVATDSIGDTFVTGTQNGTVLVYKLDPAGHTVLVRNISGQGPDTASGLAADGAGNVYVAGRTSSSTFPIHNAMQSAPGPGFIVKLSADGSQLVWSTYFREAITALAVDSGGNVYVTGSTNDSKFPVTAGLPAGAVSNDVGAVSGAFLTKISAAGDRVVYSTVLAGQAKDCGCCSSCFLSARNTGGVSVAVDASGNAYVAGNTDTHDLPATAGAFLQVGVGPFVAKVKADGSGVAYLTYLSYTEYPLSPATNPANTATAIAVDAVGNAYLTGTTFDPNFPATKGAYQTMYAGQLNPASVNVPRDVFAVKLNPSGSALVWASYLGGRAAESVNSITVDSSLQAWLVGTTASPEFPNAQGWSQGSDFLTGFDPTGSKLVYSARYPNDGVSRAVSVDPTGLLHVAGPTGIVSAISPLNPPLPRIFGVANAANGPLDGRVANGEVVSIYGPHIGPATPLIAVPDSSGNLPGTINGYLVAASLPNAAPLPILYLSDSQINAVIPFGAYASGPIHIVTPNGITPDFPLIVLPARPEEFAVALNQDGTLNSVNNPATAGSYEAIWVTGSGFRNTGGNAGQIATGAKDFYCCEVELNQEPVPVVYAGNAPGAVMGVSQVNFQIPAVPMFSSTLSLRVVANDGSLSRPIALYVH